MRVSGENSLSILIPARNEEFLTETLEDLLKNIRGHTDIFVVLDGEPTVKPLPEDPRIHVIEHTEAIGQRAATNEIARMSMAKYVIKVDAHCAFDEGFDVKLIQGFKDKGDNIIQVPKMRNLWAYDWKCPVDGKRTYQDKGDVCPDCGGKMKKKMLWIAKTNPQSVSYCFDSEPHFQYFKEYTKHPDYIRDLPTGYTHSISLQGSCFALTREKYHELNICDEEFGSWGSQGIEIALKLWLSGGEVIINHHTWYAHMFRTKGVFSFPYKQSGKKIERAKNMTKDFFFNNRWDKQVRTLGSVLKQFAPVRGWSDEDMKAQKERDSKWNMV